MYVGFLTRIGGSVKGYQDEDAIRNVIGFLRAADLRWFTAWMAQTDSRNVHARRNLVSFGKKGLAAKDVW